MSEASKTHDALSRDDANPIYFQQPKIVVSSTINS